MRRYIVQRLWQGIILLVLVTTIVFFLGRLTGNPADLMLPEDATEEDRVALIDPLVRGHNGQEHEEDHPRRVAQRLDQASPIEPEPVHRRTDDLWQVLGEAE